MSTTTNGGPTGVTEPSRYNPKFGTLIPNRIFVGGISSDTTESELSRVFSAYGNVKSTKIIVDRAGMSKGYGFVTFETEQEARRLQADGECVVLRDRKLNIAPAIRKSQSVVPVTEANFNLNVANASTAGTVNSNAATVNAAAAAAAAGMQLDQFAAAVYYPNTGNSANTGLTTIYPSSMQYQSFYQYYSVPMNIPAIWPQYYQNL